MYVEAERRVNHDAVGRRGHMRVQPVQVEVKRRIRQDAVERHGWSR
jgi:hypothetical protein